MVKGANGQWGFGDLKQGSAGGGGAAAVGGYANAPPPASQTWRTSEEMSADMSGPDAVTVQLRTTNGPINIKVVPKWAPMGAQRFLEMVRDGFYNDIAVYRGIPNGLIQFGALQQGDPRSSQYEKLPDDPLAGIPYVDGVIGFAAAGPNTRKYTVCIIMGDFRSQLGKGAHGTPSPETPFGMVSPESMSLMHSITCLGDIPQCGGRGADPDMIEKQGNAYVRAQFPNCDYIQGAQIFK
jgi:peptidyl-prolyl cis-trans isomerase A (cyclophilin A)